MTDLHTHSTASDGQYTPKEIVSLAKKANITILALTDHDTTAGLEEAEKEAKYLGIKFIKGIELDTKHPYVKGNFHILGYNIDPYHKSLAESCSSFSKQRLERANRIFTYLEGFGVSLDRQKVFKYAGNGVVARPHFARVMHEDGYVSCIQEAFDKYLDIPDFTKVDRPKPHPKDAIKMINDAGGIAVLAHPSQLKLGDTSLYDLVCELKSYGLKGLECHYSTNTKEQTEQYTNLAQELDLYITGGSDFHGEKIKPQIALGTGINGTLNVKSNLIF